MHQFAPWPWKQINRHGLRTAKVQAQRKTYGEQYGY
jgi:hypothetical protein